MELVTLLRSQQLGVYYAVNLLWRCGPGANPQEVLSALCLHHIANTTLEAELYESVESYCGQKHNPTTKPYIQPYT
jgi:hypothetical protein